MSLPVVLRPVARREYDAAFDWYENQTPGAGVAFARVVRSVPSRISANPNLHQVVYRDARRAVVGKYPYCIYYRVLPNRIDVLSVFHSSRNPAIWQRRVPPASSP